MLESRADGAKTEKHFVCHFRLTSAFWGSPLWFAIVRNILSRWRYWHWSEAFLPNTERTALWSLFLISPNSSVIVHLAKLSEGLNIKVLSPKKSISIKYNSIYRFQVFIYLIIYLWKLIIFNLKIIKYMNQKNPILL